MKKQLTVFSATLASGIIFLACQSTSENLSPVSNSPLSAHRIDEKALGLFWAGTIDCCPQLAGDNFYLYSNFDEYVNGITDKRPTGETNQITGNDFVVEDDYGLSWTATGTLIENRNLQGEDEFNLSVTITSQDGGCSFQVTMHYTRDADGKLHMHKSEVTCL